MPKSAIHAWTKGCIFKENLLWNAPPFAAVWCADQSPLWCRTWMGIPSRATLPVQRTEPRTWKDPRGGFWKVVFCRQGCGSHTHCGPGLDVSGGNVISLNIGVSCMLVRMPDWFTCVHHPSSRDRPKITKGCGKRTGGGWLLALDSKAWQRGKRRGHGAVAVRAPQLVEH
jgi:hypothetical protein